MASARAKWAAMGGGLWLVAASVGFATAAHAQRCPKGYARVDGICCHAGEPCVGQPRLSRAVASASGRAEATTRKMQVFARATTSGGTTIEGATVLVERRPAGSDGAFVVSSELTSVRVDVQAPGYEDAWLWVPAGPEAHVQVEMRLADSLTVKVSSRDDRISPHAEVYAQCKTGEVHECVLSKETEGECSVAVSARCGTVTVRVVGNVNAELEDVTLDPSRTTTVKLEVERAPTRTWYLVPAGVLTVAAGVFSILGATASPKAADADWFYGTAGALAALDLTVGGAFIAKFLGPETSATASVDAPKNPQQKAVQVYLARASRPPPVWSKLALSPLGASFRW